MNKIMIFILICIYFLSSCSSTNYESIPFDEEVVDLTLATATTMAIRPAYYPGELVDYLAQPGDTLAALAIHFNSSETEIRLANPIIPDDATTMPPGMPMKIPIYYLPLWGTSFQIAPDNIFINGPLSISFNTSNFIALKSGWLKDYRDFASGQTRSGAEIIDLVAQNFSISPMFLLALLEYKAGALTDPIKPVSEFILGNEDYAYEGLYLQLVWAANILNNGYYGWRSGNIKTFEHPDGTLERPDPWQNAATVAIQLYFLDQPSDEYTRAIGPDGFAKTLDQLFGDPWKLGDPHIPVSLQQPVFLLPFKAGESWTYTGGPHSGWGTLEPFSAIDFAPPAEVGGCIPTDLWATAIADGIVVRSETGIIILDLDGDEDERTGWNILYLHVATEGRLPAGTRVKAGDPIGHPSCEGGRATGTHIHIARKYNGEWIPAEGTLAFTLEGWVAHNGVKPYLGTLTRGSETVIACDCSNLTSRITAGK
jgi:murein DD-endopeptidase MepM/ murein hydrolase activator NlpD